MRVADTSALYALFVAQDAHHGAAREAFADPEPILVPAEILAETIALLHYRIGSDAARHAGEALQRLPHVEVQPTWDDPFEDLLQEAWRIYGARKGRLSYPDAIVVAWCRRRRLAPLAFDAALRAAV